MTSNRLEVMFFCKIRAESSLCSDPSFQALGGHVPVEMTNALVTSKDDSVTYNRIIIESMTSMELRETCRDMMGLCWDCLGNMGGGDLRIN